MLAGTAATVLAASVLSGAQPAAAARSGMYFGAYAQPSGGESLQSAFQSVEKMSGTNLGVARVFLQWSSAFPQPYHNWLKSKNKKILLSMRGPQWSTLANASPSSSVYKQAVSWGKRLRDYKVPIYVAYHHEPEAVESNGYGSSTQFVAAYRKFVTIVRAQGASNVKFMVVLGRYAYEKSGTSDHRAANKWYPGDAYVDAIGADVYNWYNCRAANNPGWRSLGTLLEPVRAFGAKHPSKEIWLAELSSAEDKSKSGRKASWIHEARATLKQSKYSQFHGATWFDSNNKCDWRVDTSSSAKSAFGSLARDGFFK